MRNMAYSYAIVALICAIGVERQLSKNNDKENGESPYG